MSKDIESIIKQVMQKLESKGIISSKVYTDEPILRKASQMKNFMPEKYREMKALARSREAYRNTDAWLFYKQGKFMEDFRDDYPFHGNVVRYFPTYKMLSDEELRGYFSWRTKYRDGVLEKAPTSFAFIYIYELLNLIGVKDAKEGFNKLIEIRDNYAMLDPSILSYLVVWIEDFVVYYGLDVSLLEKEALGHSEMLGVLRDYDKHGDEELFEAITELSSYSMSTSKFCKNRREEYMFVVVYVYRELCEIFRKSRKNSLFTHLFGSYSSMPYYMFRASVFYQQKRHADCVYVLDEFRKFICKDGRWTEESFHVTSKSRELGEITRYIDYRLRIYFEFPSKIKETKATKQVEGLVDKALVLFEEEKKRKEASKIVIDVSKLQEIRDAADITREKLITEEETDFDVVEDKPTEDVAVLNEESGRGGRDFGLTRAEMAILSALFDGGDVEATARSEGVMLSVAVDSINEKLFDEFGDTVIVFEGDLPVLIEDYIDDLRGFLKI